MYPNPFPSLHHLSFFKLETRTRKFVRMKKKKMSEGKGKKCYILGIVRISCWNTYTPFAYNTNEEIAINQTEKQQKLPHSTKNSAEQPIS